MEIQTYNKKGHSIIKHITEEEEQEMYLDWVNNFISVSSFAQYYEMSYFSANILIKKQTIKRIKMIENIKKLNN